MIYRKIKINDKKYVIYSRKIFLLIMIWMYILTAWLFFENYFNLKSLRHKNVYFESKINEEIYNIDNKLNKIKLELKKYRRIK
jgi:hypothetical protein